MSEVEGRYCPQCHTCPMWLTAENWKCPNCLHEEPLYSYNPIKEITNPKQAKIYPIHSNNGRWVLNWCLGKTIYSDKDAYLYHHYFKKKKDADEFIEKNALILEVNHSE